MEQNSDPFDEIEHISVLRDVAIILNELHRTNSGRSPFLEEMADLISARLMEMTEWMFSQEE